MWRRSRTFQRAASRPLPTASTAWPTSRSRVVRAWRRQSSVWSVDHGCWSPAPIVSSELPRLSASRSSVWRASTNRDAGKHERDHDPDRGPEEWCPRPATSRCSPGSTCTAASTTRMLIGTCLAAAAREPQDELGDAERHGDEHGDGQAVQAERVADGQRDEDAEHHRSAALERRAHRRPHRHLHHDDGRQRSEHRVRHARDDPSDPPRQAGRQTRTWPPCRSRSTSAASTRPRGPRAATAVG